MSICDVSQDCPGRDVHPTSDLIKLLKAKRGASPDAAPDPQGSSKMQNASTPDTQNAGPGCQHVHGTTARALCTHG